MIVEPHLKGKEREFIAFCGWLTNHAPGSAAGQTLLDVPSAREKLRHLSSGLPNESEVRLLLACSIMVDMAARGWRICVRGKRVELQPPSLNSASSAEMKAHVRRGHLLERDVQLTEPSVREFVGRMEQRKLGPHGWHSIFSLMRDGRDLASQLRKATAVSEAERMHYLPGVISPYVQIVEPDA